MPRDLRLLILGGLFTVFAAGHANAQNRQSPQPAQPLEASQPAAQPSAVVAAPTAELPLVELAPLLQRVERASNKRFVVDRYIGPRVFLAGVEADDVTYPVLLSILRANNLAAAEIEGRVNIVPVHEIRNYPLPMVQNEDPSIAADEWVTRVLTTNAQAALFVPILRPLLPAAAHLAAMPEQNKLLIVDRYANVRRITQLVRSLDAPASN
jgi:general secretion pathway protein D